MYEVYQKLLDEKGLKNADVARATGISNMTLSDWKRGKSVPKSDKMRKIAEYLNTSVNYLMTGNKKEFKIETADMDSELIFMEKRIQEYALKLSKLSEEDKTLIINMIDRLGKWGMIMKCKKCKNELRIESVKMGEDKKGIPIYHRIAYCDFCETENDLDKKNKKKKDSILSIIAAVLGFFNITCFVGGIIGIVDLAINNKEKRHLGSWFAIIMCALWIIVSTANRDINEPIQQTQSESVNQVQASNNKNTVYTYQDGLSFDNDGLKITLNSIDLDYKDYVDQFGIYKPDDGKKYISVSFNYENQGDKDKYVSIYDYDCYADGSLVEQTYLSNSDFTSANISSGRNVSFETYYIVPIDTKEIELEYKELASFDDKKIIIKLQ